MFWLINAYIKVQEDQKNFSYQLFLKKNANLDDINCSLKGWTCFAPSYLSLKRFNNRLGPIGLLLSHEYLAKPDFSLRISQIGFRHITLFNILRIQVDYAFHPLVQYVAFSDNLLWMTLSYSILTTSKLVLF